MILAVLMSAALANDDPTHLPGVVMQYGDWETRIHLVEELRTYDAASSHRLAIAHAVLKDLAENEPQASNARVERLLVASLVPDPSFQQAARAAARDGTPLLILDPRHPVPEVLRGYVRRSWDQLRPLNVSRHQLEPFTFAAPLLRYTSRGIGLQPEELRLQLVELTRDAGWPVTGAENPVFEEDHSDRARFVIGAEILTVYDARPRPGGDLGLGLDIRWQVFDRIRDQVIFDATTRGWAPEDNPTALLASNVHNLLSRATLMDALTAAPSFEDADELRIKRCSIQARSLLEGGEAALASTVHIEHDDTQGTGTLVSEDGWVWTSASVVAGTREVHVTLEDGLTLPASVIRQDRDVALLKLAGSGYPCLPTAASSLLLGTPVFGVSWTPGELPFVSEGVVSEARASDRIQTSAATPANLGGPLLSTTGHLQGVIGGAAEDGSAYAVAGYAVMQSLSLTWADFSDHADPMPHDLVPGIRPADRSLVRLEPGELCLFRRGHAKAGPILSWGSSGEKLRMAGGQLGCSVMHPDVLPITIRDSHVVTVDVREGQRTVLEVIRKGSRWELVSSNDRTLERLHHRGKLELVDPSENRLRAGR
ncbi:MAG TPA: serine protease [Deltaproteobacteria bacterium]|nr:serine protease [Deltaproteobacteria bacterium]